MPLHVPLRVAVLVDLPRSPQAGGHVKCWERLALAASQSSLPLDLTVYFSGSKPDEILGPRTRLRHLPPVFSTARLKFLPYVPDHTDLAPYHPQLARELKDYDVIHTTDGYFAFAQTAERVSRQTGIPLVTSFHTDTPSYARIFTRQTIEKLFHRWPLLRRWLIEDWKMPDRQQRAKEVRLQKHIRACRRALVTRQEDQTLAETVLGSSHVHHLRLGVDKDIFRPDTPDRAGIERDYGIPPGRCIILFVGRVDVGKNIYTLVDAMKLLVQDKVPLHLITAGQGPAEAEVKTRLAGSVSVPGFVSPEKLAVLFRSADALALVSEVEIRSMVGVEAMASGCPVLVSHKSGIAELFHHTSAMREVDGGPETWADELRRFAADPQQRQQMHDAAITYSAAYLASWQDVLAEDLFAVWREVASTQETRAA